MAHRYYFDGDLLAHLARYRMRPYLAALDCPMEQETDMAQLIEIKGLGADLAAAKAGIKGVRSGVKDVGISAGLLTAELKDVHTQLESARDDLRFEAETLGNSGGTGSNQSDQQGATTTVITSTDVATTANSSFDHATGDPVK